MAAWSGWLVQRLVRSPLQGSGRVNALGRSALIRSGIEGGAEILPALGVLGARHSHEAGSGAASAAVERDEDRAGLELRPLRLVALGVPLAHRSIAAREELPAVEDDHPWPGGRVEGRDDERGEGIEVVDREVRLSARSGGPATVAQHRRPELATRGAQAHALADAEQEPGDLGRARRWTPGPS
jgi:hypothetical protein